MKTCLIVDDLDFNRAAASKMLIKMGFAVEEAKDASEVGMYFEGQGDKDINNIDFVLMDWHIPDIDGPKITEIIKQMRPRSVVFLYTAIGDDDEGIALAEKVGADGFITKTLSRDKLEESLIEKGLL